jgi:hypothetical protein
MKKTTLVFKLLNNGNGCGHDRVKIFTVSAITVVTIQIAVIAV